MDPRTVARALTLGRIAIGAALIAAPARASSGWIGGDARRPATQVPLASLGARDVVLGVGGAWADDKRPWLLGAALSDLADLYETLRHRDALPMTGVIGVGALAGGAAIAGLWAANQLD
jgi:hypothetical protein